jgi:hypothetical protein
MAVSACQSVSPVNSSAEMIIRFAEGTAVTRLSLTMTLAPANSAGAATCTVAGRQPDFRNWGMILEKIEIKSDVTS